MVLALTLSTAVGGFAPAARAGADFTTAQSVREALNDPAVLAELASRLEEPGAVESALRTVDCGDDPLCWLLQTLVGALVDQCGGLGRIIGQEPCAALGAVGGTAVDAGKSATTPVWNLLVSIAGYCSTHPTTYPCYCIPSLPCGPPGLPTDE